MDLRRWLTIIAFSLSGFAAPLHATLAASVQNDANALILPSGNAFAKVESEVPAWALTNIVPSNAFTDTLLSDERVAARAVTGAELSEAATLLSPDQGRSEARVPEPGTLIFVGTGLIALAKVSRSKLRRDRAGRGLVRVYATPL